MSKVRKVASYVVKRGKIDAIVSMVSLIACITMIIILGAVATICSTIEDIYKDHRRNKRRG